METTKYNALEELHNELNRGTPGDEVSLNIGGKEVLRVKQVSNWRHSYYRA